MYEKIVFLLEGTEQQIEVSYSMAQKKQYMQIRQVLDLSLLFAVVQLDIDLCSKIVAFGRSLRYMLSITDEVCKHVLGSLDSDLTEVFFFLISEKIVLRFNGKKDLA